MTNLESLLKDISKIVVEEKTRQEEGRKRGEKFNIFNVLGLSRNEVRLHSAFLAELLNPNGSHGLGDKFLKAFITNVINDENFQFDSASAKPQVEFTIGNINEEYTKGGRIDILIQDKNKQSIIIENKIDASDQPKQLLRYYNYIKNNPQYRILYLTKEGTEPDESSFGGSKDIKYQCISYRNDILRWLDRCTEIAALSPMVRETICQYRNNLNEILTIMDNTNNNFINTLTSSENINTTFAIIEQAGEVYNRIRENFVDQIKDYCKEIGYECYADEGIKTASHNSWIHIFDPNLRDIEFRIGVKKHTDQDGFRMCFVSHTRQQTTSNYRFWKNDYPIEEFPFGWVYLWGEDGVHGMWWRWDNINTLKDMTNGKMFNFIKGQLCRIKKEDTFNYMNSLLK